MTWADGGLQHSDGAGNLVFASHLNTKAMQERGNKAINGCEVTEQSPTPDLTVEVEAGNVIANGIVLPLSALDPFSGTSATFATTQGLLTSGQAEFVAIHVRIESFTDGSNGIDLNENGGSADTIDRNDAGSWITDGFQVGDQIEVVDANTPANDGIYTIASLTAAIITISIGDLTSDDIADTGVTVRAAIISNTEGGAAAAGQQTPPEVPEDEVLLAMITLSEGDSTISTVDIEDWRQFTPDGIALADNKEFIFGNDGDFHLKFNSSSGNFEITDGSNVLFSFVDSGSFGTLLGIAIDTDGQNIDLSTGSLIVDSSGDVTLSAAELAFLDGLTESVQTFMNSFGTITNTPAIDQSLLTSSSPVFAGIGASGDSDLIQLATNSVTVNGVLETTNWSSNRNTQSHDPSANFDASGGHGTSKWWYLYNTDWGQPASNTFQGQIIQYGQQWNVGVLALNISKIRITVDNPSYTTANGSGTENVTMRWEYTIDGGTVYTVVDTQVISCDGTGGSLAWSTTNVEIDGDAVTGDIKVVISAQFTSAIGTSTWINIGNWTSYYQSALKTP